MANKSIILTDSEVKTLSHYLGNALIEAKGYAAIGIETSQSVENLESILRKISI